MEPLRLRGHLNEEKYWIEKCTNGAHLPTQLSKHMNCLAKNEHLYGFEIINGLICTFFIQMGNR
jgi:hypothetical protein